MSEIYLTPNLIIRNNKTYYHNDETDKIIRVTSSNWHKYMCDYNWEKLDNGWIRRLNRFKKNKKKNNSEWGLLDTGGEGNCLFNVIAEAIGEPDPQEIRKLAARMISEDNFATIIEAYRIMFDANDFIHEWNPHGIEYAEELREELEKEGNNFWGDHIVMQLISEGLGINIIVLNSENEDKMNEKLDERFRIHNIGNILHSNRKTIIVYYIDSIHFKLVGYFTGSYMCTLFDKLPEELWLLYRNDCKM